MAGGGGDFPVGLEGDGSEVEDAAAFFVREKAGDGRVSRQLQQSLPPPLPQKKRHRSPPERRLPLRPDETIQRKTHPGLRPRPRHHRPPPGRRRPLHPLLRSRPPPDLLESLHRLPPPRPREKSPSEKRNRRMQGVLRGPWKLPVASLGTMEVPSCQLWSH